jgi:hypothetical protein
VTGRDFQREWAPRWRVGRSTLREPAGKAARIDTADVGSHGEAGSVHHIAVRGIGCASRCGCGSYLGLEGVRSSGGIARAPLCCNLGRCW